MISVAIGPVLWVNTTGELFCGGLRFLHVPLQRGPEDAAAVHVAHGGLVLEIARRPPHAVMARFPGYAIAAKNPAIRARLAQWPMFQVCGRARIGGLLVSASPRCLWIDDRAFGPSLDNARGRALDVGAEGVTVHAAR